MLPLRDGTANVIEFGTDGKVTLHPFNCLEIEEHFAPKISNFRMSSDGKFIHLNSPVSNSDLEILFLNPRAMKLSMVIQKLHLTFRYLRIEKVRSLCAIYPDAAGERAREAARPPF